MGISFITLASSSGLIFKAESSVTACCLLALLEESSILSRLSLVAAYLSKLFQASVFVVKFRALSSAERVKYEFTGDKDVKYLGDAICLGEACPLAPVLGDDYLAPFSAASLSQFF